MKTGGKVHSLIAVMLALAVCAFFFFTVRKGHDWGGDFSMYIHHAKNIAEGKGYSDTGYILNPAYPLLAPESYPPVFPLILVPAYRMCGMDLICMKREIVIIFFLSLLVVHLLFRKGLSPWYSVAALGVFSMNPVFWDCKDQILSDIPFMFFSLAALYFLAWEDLCGGEECPAGDGGAACDGRSGAVFGGTKGLFSASCAAAAGLLIYLAYGTRSAGVVLLPVCFLHDYSKNGRFTKMPFITAAVFAVPAVLQNALIRSEGAYLSQFMADPSAVLDNLLRYPRALAELWNNNRVRGIDLVTYGLFSMLAAAGFIKRSKKGAGPAEYFLVLYLAVVLVFPGYGGIRYLIPVVPLYIFYAFYAFDTLLRGRRARAAGLALLIFAAGSTYVSNYSSRDYGPIREGPEKRESAELFEFIRSRTSSTDIIIFRKPRVMALYGGRSSASYQLSHDTAAIMDFIKDIGASYIVSGPFRDDVEFLAPLISERSAVLDQVFTNVDFTVYRIIREPLSGTMTEDPRSLSVQCLDRSP